MLEPQEGEIWVIREELRPLVEKYFGPCKTLEIPFMLIPDILDYCWVRFSTDILSRRFRRKR